MIVEVVEFGMMPGEGRAEMVEASRTGSKRWAKEPGLVRKHYILSADGKTAGGVYVWTSAEDAERAHNKEWRDRIEARTGRAPVIRVFDMFAYVDNEAGRVIEYAADGRAVVAAE